MLTNRTWCGSLKLKGIVPSKTALTSNVSCKWGPEASGTSDWLATHLRGSHDCLRFDNSLEWLAGLRKALYLWLQFYCKEYKSGPFEWRHRGRIWEGSQCWASMPSPCGTLGVSPSCNIIVFTNYRAHGIQSFYWVFIMLAWLIQPLAVWMNSVCSPVLSSRLG